MEYLDIVDEHGNFTGTVMEREQAHDWNMLHWEVSVFVINDKKQVLLEKRASNKRYSPNKWGTCAGHVDSGESIENAAVRELGEEIGLKISKEDLHVLDPMYVTIREVNSHLTRFFYVLCNERKFTTQEEELSEVKWFTIDDVIKMIHNHDETLTLKENRLYLLEKLKQLYENK